MGSSQSEQAEDAVDGGASCGSGPAQEWRLEWVQGLRWPSAHAHWALQLWWRWWGLQRRLLLDQRLGTQTALMQPGLIWQVEQRQLDLQRWPQHPPQTLLPRTPQWR